MKIGHREARKIAMVLLVLIVAVIVAFLLFIGLLINKSIANHEQKVQQRLEQKEAIISKLQSGQKNKFYYIERVGKYRNSWGEPRFGRVKVQYFNNGIYYIPGGGEESLRVLSALIEDHPGCR